MSSSRRWLVAVVAAALVTGVAFAAGAAFPSTHRIVDANGDVFDVAAPFTVDTVPPQAVVDDLSGSVDLVEGLDGREDPDGRGDRRPPRTTTTTTTQPPTTTTRPPRSTTTTLPPVTTTLPPGGGGGNGTQVSGFISGGFTVPAGETWAVDGEVIVDGDVNILGTLEMRAGDTLTLDTGSNCQTQVMVMDDGILDAIGTTKTGWTRDPQNATGWLSSDEILVAPIALGDYSFTAWDGGPAPRIASDLPAAEVLNLDRDVVIRSTVEHCGRVMFMGDQPQYMAYVEVDGLGITGELGWYPIHMHERGDASRGSLFEGIVVKNGGNHAFVYHASHGVTARDTIAYNIVGAAYWWDGVRGGNEQNATNDVTYDHAMAALVYPAANDRGGDDFTNAGFSLMAGEGGVVVDSVAVAVLGPKDASGFSWPALEEHVYVFEDNVAHNITKNGIWVWHNSGTLNPIERFTAYSNGSAGIDHGAYNNNFKFTDIRLHNNGETGIDLHAGTNGEQVWTNVVVTDSPMGIRFSDATLPHWPVPFVCYVGPKVGDSRAVFYSCDDVA